MIELTAARRQKAFHLLGSMARIVLVPLLLIWVLWQFVGAGGWNALGFLDVCLAVTGGMLLVAVLAGSLPFFARLVGAVEGGIWELVEGGIPTCLAPRQLVAERNVPRTL